MPPRRLWEVEDVRGGMRERGALKGFATRF